MSDLWDKGSSGDKPSYVKAMLTHQYNLYAFLSACAMGTMAAIPYGFGVGALPVLAYGATAAIATLFIPSHPKFKEWVNRRDGKEKREKARAHLEAEIGRRAWAEDPNWVSYRRMLDRLDSLRRMASSRETSISSRDVDRLDDATVNFLGLWLAHLVIDEREAAVDEDGVRHRIAEVDRQLTATSSAADRRRLLKAKQDLERVLTRRERMHGRRAAVDAAMLAMADAFDEVFQGVMANPTGDIAKHLQEAVERINLEEELGTALEEELGEVLPNRAAQAMRAPTR